ncbi:zinc finger protein 22-like [Crotalus tigris]|uniref:zinc finger protein 22-like n=1 Tax=Crotalus tigris TaxID=88082 RepID=UPI00192F76F4|nr:zinc finger protein 22-like [Crotalus tigris]
MNSRIWGTTCKCLQCGKSFTESQGLRKYQSIHRGEKAYKCRECGSSCSQRGNLYRHQRLHSGEKPYKCVERVSVGREVFIGINPLWRKTIQIP